MNAMCSYGPRPVGNKQSEYLVSWRDWDRQTPLIWLDGTWSYVQHLLLSSHLRFSSLLLFSSSILFLVFFIFFFIFCFRFLVPSSPVFYKFFYHVFPLRLHERQSLVDGLSFFHLYRIFLKYYNSRNNFPLPFPLPFSPSPYSFICVVKFNDMTYELPLFIHRYTSYQFKYSDKCRHYYKYSWIIITSYQSYFLINYG